MISIFLHGEELHHLLSDWLWAPLLYTLESDMGDSMNKEHFGRRDDKVF